MKKSLLKNWERLFKRVYAIEKYFLITELFNLLPKREQKIISMRFGLKDGITHTLEEVSKEVGVTRERIRQLEAKSLEKLRKAQKIKSK